MGLKTAPLGSMIIRFSANLLNLVLLFSFALIVLTAPRNKAFGAVVIGQGEGLSVVAAKKVSEYDFTVKKDMAIPTLDAFKSCSIDTDFCSNINRFFRLSRLDDWLDGKISEEIHSWLDWQFAEVRKFRSDRSGQRNSASKVFDFEQNFREGVVYWTGGVGKESKSRKGLDDIVLNGGIQKWTFEIAERPFRRLGGFVSGGSSSGGGVQSSSQIFGLSDEYNQLPKQCENCEDAQKPRPPIGFGFFVGFACFAGSYLCAFFGGQRLNDKRKILGATLVGSSFLLLSLSLVLISTSRGSL